MSDACVRYSRRLQEAAAAAAATQASSNSQEGNDSPPGPVPRAKSPTHVVPSQSSTSPYPESTLSPVATIPAPSPFLPHVIL